MKVFACGTSWGSNRDQFLKSFQGRGRVLGNCSETGSEYTDVFLRVEPHVKKLSLEKKKIYIYSEVS